MITERDVSKVLDRREVIVPAIIDPILAAVPHSNRPILESLDSGEECSFYHWVEVCKLVDDADIPPADEEIQYSREIEAALEEALSEVEPTTAYQHFAGNVV